MYDIPRSDFSENLVKGIEYAECNINNFYNYSILTFIMKIIYIAVVKILHIKYKKLCSDMNNYMF